MRWSLSKVSRFQGGCPKTIWLSCCNRLHCSEESTLCHRDFLAVFSFTTLASNVGGEPRQQPERGTSGATVWVVKGPWIFFYPWTSCACQGVRCFSRALRMGNNCRIHAG